MPFRVKRLFGSRPLPLVSTAWLVEAMLDDDSMRVDGGRKEGLTSFASDKRKARTVVGGRGGGRACLVSLHLGYVEGERKRKKNCEGHRWGEQRRKQEMVHGRRLCARRTYLPHMLVDWDGVTGARDDGVVMLVWYTE